MILAKGCSTRIISGVLLLIASSLGVEATGLGRILEVSRASLAEDLTVLTIHADRVIEAGDWSAEQLPDPPRSVVRLKDFGPLQAPGTITYDDRLIRRVRFGFHPECEPVELHIVVDLASEDIQTARIRASGKNLLVYLVRTEPPHDPRPSPTPDPTPPLPTPFPLPTSAPTPQPSPTPTPGPTEVWPPPRPTPPDGFQLPTPTPRPLTKLVEVVTTSRGDGTTSLRITTAQALAPGTFGSYRVGDSPPRHVISLVGVTAAGVNPIVPGVDSNVVGIRIEPKKGAAGDQIHLILELTGANVEVTRTVQNGEDLVFLLEPRTIR